jgi:Aspartyl/Asparaginyl beta-hydroxylase
MQTIKVERLENIRLQTHRTMRDLGYLDRLARAGQQLARWHRYADGLGSRGVKADDDPLVRPTIFPMMEGLGTPPWRETEHILAANILEASFETIRREFESVSTSQYLHYPAMIVKGGRWTVLPLFVFGEDVSTLQGAVNLFPRTLEIIRSLPDVCADLPLADITFSAHAPHTHLAAHCSQDPFRLRLHLGLRVPDKCRIRVGSVTREWREGEVLAFHDACEHETWNGSAADRTILIVDLWHPDLTQVEREAIAACFRKSEIRTELVRLRVPPQEATLLEQRFNDVDRNEEWRSKYWGSANASDERASADTTEERVT